jgi:cytochrome b subunit of formate dehydrogenase
MGYSVIRPRRGHEELGRFPHLSVPLTPWLIAALAALALLACPPALAQSNDDCLMCHQDPGLKGTHAGRTISVHVSQKTLAASAHRELECVACHQDLSGAEFPHTEQPKRAYCGACHDQEAKQHSQSLHGQAAARGDKLAPSCSDCHGAHGIVSPKDPKSPTALINVPLLCGKCHHEGSPVSLTHDIPQDRIMENYSESIHGEGLYKKGLTVTAVCTSCHTSHMILPHTDPRSSINRRNVAKTCQQCHARIEQVHRKVVEGRLWEQEPESVPACVDCHSPHKIRKVFYPAGTANKDCLSCHGKPDLTRVKDGTTQSLYVDENAYATSTHAGTACAQCHTEVTPSLKRACETIKSPVNCSVCHAQQVTDFNEGLHGELLAKKDPDAPACIDCHEKHATMSSKQPTSPTYARNVPELCARCHREGEKAAARLHTAVPIVQSYEESIHGKGLLKSGLVVTATCDDCHTPHRVLPPADPRSSVNTRNIAGTCGQCHHGIEEIFRTSIHWPANAKTDKELPTCEKCHSSHSISRTDQANFRFRMMDQCGRCHAAEAETFFDTFHGKVSRLGSAGAAKCYDCHGTHDILPPTDPRSHLSRQNVVQTCSQCHAGAHRRFAGYLTHATHHDSKKYPWLFYSFWGMTALLVGTLTFALFHTIAWLIRLWLTRAHWKRAAPAPGEKLYRRFDRFQRTLHLFMLVSFFTLALTGMTLKFSYMNWALVLSQLLGGFEAMGVMHRLGAVTLTCVFFVHLFELRRRRRTAGLTWMQMIFGPDSILLSFRDVKEIIASMKWFFGIGPRPKYGRYTYWEKFDYFAVFWGVLVIGSTGCILWFPEFFTYIVPGWFVNVATIIHSDEALLAVAFIFTIHFFNTHFRPDKFPMDPVIFTGRMSLEELKHDKPAEYERLLASGQLEKHMVDPFPAGVERGLKVFGFIALAVGLTLIGLILYAMLFAYL